MFARKWIAPLVCVLAAGYATAQDPGDIGPHRWTWKFHDGRSGEPPDDFAFAHRGAGGHGRWRVQSAKDAPSGSKVLAQQEASGEMTLWRFAFPREQSFGDLTADVSLKFSSGGKTRACGLVMRYKDESNHYALELDDVRGRVALLAVKEGAVRVVASKAIEPGQSGWRELRLDVRRSSFEAILDNQSLFECEDDTLGGYGQAGLFSRADTVAMFDDLICDPLAPGE